MIKNEKQTRIVTQGHDNGDRTSRKNRDYSVTTETVKKIDWVRELLQQRDLRTLTIRSLAREVKERFGTSMNTNLLADLLLSARTGEDAPSISITSSKRGRPTTLSPRKAVRQALGRQVRRITDTLIANPNHIVCVETNGEIRVHGHKEAADAQQHIEDLLQQGVPASRIAYYMRGEVQADLKVTLVQPTA